MESEENVIKKSSAYLYRLYLGDNLKDSSLNKPVMLLEQRSQADYEAEDKKKYTVTLNGIKFYRKMYQPGKIEAEITISSDTQTGLVPSTTEVSKMLMQRRVELHLQPTNVDEAAEITDAGKAIVLAKNYYVHEISTKIVPLYNNGGKALFVKLTIYSLDKLLTLDKYSKVYVAKKLGSHILEDELKVFGLQKLFNKSLRHLSYSEDDSGAKVPAEFIQPYLVQYNESFYDFIVRTANRCGEFFYFEDGGLMLGLPKLEKVTEDDPPKIVQIEPSVIDGYSSVTLQDITGGSLDINAYSRDSIKDGVGNMSDKGTNFQAVKSEKGYPKDIFPDKLSFNAELANDEYFFPLYKGKFSSFLHETWRDGTPSEITLSTAIPILRDFLANTLLDTTIALIVFGVVQAALEVKKDYTGNSRAKDVDEEGVKRFLEPMKGKSEQYDGSSAVLFGPLNNEGWTKLKYYTDVRKYEEEQQEKIICIDMGRRFVPVKLGQTVKVDGMTGQYVIIQIDQVSDEDWKTNYQTFGSDSQASDKTMGSQSMVIYAIPTYTNPTTKKDDVMPPVHPAPFIRKAGPQTAFIADNNDPKHQGRVRIVYPWQSVAVLETQALENAEKSLAESVAAQQKAKAKVEEIRAAIKILRIDIEWMGMSTEELQDLTIQREEEIKDCDEAIAKKQEEKTSMEAEKAAKEAELAALPTTDASYPIKRDVLKTEIAGLELRIERCPQEIEALEKKKKRYEESKADIQSALADREKGETTTIDKKKAELEAKEQEQLVAEEDLGKADKSVEYNIQVVAKNAISRDEVIKSAASPWIRVSMPMATEGGGVWFKPRKGDEVLVNYDNDNIERPYVVGSLFSKNVLDTDPLYDRKAGIESVWKDRSMSLTSPNGHNITFIDPEGMKKFVTNLNPGVKFYAPFLPIPEFAPEGKPLSGGIHLGDRYGIYSIDMTSHNRNITISSPFGDININAFSGIKITAPNGDVSIEGKNISIKAGNNLTLLSGLNIEDPGIGKAKSKAASAGNTILAIANAAVGALTDMFVNILVDLSYFRHILEVYVRPVEGTMCLKSKKYLKLEAGSGNATIARDRYSDKWSAMKKMESTQDFYKALLTVIDYMLPKIEKFYTDYDTMWSDAHRKYQIYKRYSIPLLKAEEDPSVMNEIFKKSTDGEWDKTMIPDTFFDNKIKDGDIVADGQHLTKLKPKKNCLLSRGRTLGQAVFKLHKHVLSFTSLFDDCEVQEGYIWIPTCATTAMGDFGARELDKWRDLYGNDGGAPDPLFLSTDKDHRSDEDPFASSDSKIFFKRRLIALFLKGVNDHNKNKTEKGKPGKYFKIDIDKSQVETNKHLLEDYYWKRLVKYLEYPDCSNDAFASQKLGVFKMGHEVQNQWAYNVLYPSFVNFWDKAKSNFRPLDRDIWSDSKGGQILFSDQEDSTLNFEGEGLHQEHDANIGNLAHLKKVLMGIK